MARIKIDFVSVKVHSDGDNWPNGKGEIYYEFRVDNDVVAARPRDNHISVDSGQTFAINETQVIERPNTPNANFAVSGYLAEADGLFSGADDHAGSFFKVYSSAEGWNPGNKQVRLSGGGVEVTINYKISVL